MKITPLPIKNSIQTLTKHMTTLHLRKSIGRSLWRRGYLLIALAWVALSPAIRAVSPPPDGGYANGNTAEGTDALFSLTTGTDNTATGFLALFSNTTGSFNTAAGFEALGANTTGFENTANGFQALLNNTTGFQNAANGFRALVANTIGFHNTANGFQALVANTTGNHNTAIGDSGLESNTTGNFNTVEGAHALVTNTTGNFNIALGFAAGENLTGSNNMDISNGGVAGESNTIRIGNEVAFTDRNGIMHPAHIRTLIAGISGRTAVGGTAVLVDSSGQLGTMTSSARFKDEIKPMDNASEALLALKPVTFRYKKEIDPVGISQFGLVAEDVQKVNPDLVVRDKEGKPYSVRYDQVNAMLLNEFLKEHRMVQEQKANIAKLKQSFAQQQKQIEALTAGLQKVSAQVEMNRAAPQMVVNGR
jgi:hypothetical protein